MEITAGDAVRLRRAQTDDALGVAIVQAYTWSTTYAALMPPHVIQHRIDRLEEQADLLRAQMESGVCYWVAEKEKAVVGFACLGPSANADYAGDGEIYALYLLRAFQRKGVGKRLFSLCLQQLHARGYENVIVNCLQGNPALAFYLARGGQVVGQRSDWVDGAFLTEQIVRFVKRDV